MNDFFMDREKESRIIKEQYKNLKGLGRIFKFINFILKKLIILPVILVILVIAYSVAINEIDVEAYIMFFMLAVFFSVIIWSISFILERIIWMIFMPIWTGSNNMELHLQNEGVEFGTCITGDNWFRTYFFDYADISGLEFDTKNHLFCISGKYKNTTWKNVNRLEHVNTNEKTLEIKRVVFLEYFKDFDVFLSKLQEKTGLNVDYVEIKL